MAHYRKDAASNRDALFGGGGGGGGGARKAPAARAPAPRSRTSAAAAATSAPSAITTTSTTTIPAPPSVTPGPSAIFAPAGRSSRTSPLSVLTGDAKIAKMAEAEDYRLKAKKAMSRGVFSKPDPISAANFYNRAADAYKMCGENRLERLHRIASGDCQLGQDAYATAAAEYTRAAELAETSDESLERKRKECHKLHLDAANAWAQMGERGRAAESTMKAAFGLIMGEDATKKMDGPALKAVEEAIETFVPDPLNKKRDYRRTGVSAYEGGEQSDEEALQLARQNVICDSYAHETVLKAGVELIKRRHYESALYAHGAGTASLELEGIATVSLSRAYLSEAIVTLAMGDAVAAGRDFADYHLQRTSYLSSRECALEEDLVRACTEMDEEALEEARSRGGPHRSALANLDPAVRGLVMEIRVSGRAGGKKKGVAEGRRVETNAPAAANVGVGAPVAAAVATSKPQPPKKKEGLSGEALVQDTDAGFAEMDDIMNQMGLNDDYEEDDDEIDLT
ncbi:hypothetical protein ACHAXT_000077 [Thalassiosira profunda]